MSDILLFLAEHAGLIELLFDSIMNKGVDPQAVVEAIKKELVAKADAEERAELGP